MNATTIQNVVTYNTTIAFDNPDLRLFPGMTAYVSIPVATANNVVKIPNGALRFKPDLTDSERKTLYAKYNINDNAGGTAAGRIAAGNGPAAAVGAAGGQGPRWRSPECHWKRGWRWRRSGPRRRPGRRRKPPRPRRGGVWRRRRAGGGGGQGRRARGGRKQPARGYGHCLEAASGQDSRACPSGTWRHRLYVYGDGEWNTETRGRARHRPGGRKDDDCAEPNPQPVDRTRRRTSRCRAQVLV